MDEARALGAQLIPLLPGKAVDRKGRPITVKLKGKVEPFYKNPAPDAQ